MNIYVFTWFHLVSLHARVLADSAAAEKRFTAKSTGSLLQGAAGTTGEEGKRKKKIPLKWFRDTRHSMHTMLCTLIHQMVGSSVEFLWPCRVKVCFSLDLSSVKVKGKKIASGKSYGSLIFTMATIKAGNELFSCLSRRACLTHGFWDYLVPHF